MILPRLLLRYTNILTCLICLFLACIQNCSKLVIYSVSEIVNLESSMIVVSNIFYISIEIPNTQMYKNSSHINNSLHLDSPTRHSLFLLVLCSIRSQTLFGQNLAFILLLCQQATICALFLCNQWRKLDKT